jgi:predicted nuclease of predicted toxin-antitoxin system
VRFLVDECITPEVARFLVVAGHDAVHVCDLDLLGCSDIEVMEAAVEASRVVISADTDFGELLAKGHRTLPSVILLRRRHDPPGQISAILAAMPDIAQTLEGGAVVVITEDRVRIRTLPIEQ